VVRLLAFKHMMCHIHTVLSVGMRGNAVPTPFLPRLCLVSVFYMDFLWLCNANEIMRSRNSNALLNLFPRKTTEPTEFRVVI